MEQTIFTSLPIGELETLMINCFTACLKQHIKADPQPTANQPQKELFTVPQTATFLSLSVPTIYGLIHKGDLPYMKQGKRCYFLKADLMSYLMQGRRKSNAEIKEEVSKVVKSINH
jgi:excisionase family DNA binding protein